MSKYLYYHTTEGKDFYVETYKTEDKAANACKTKNEKMNIALRQKGAYYFIKIKL